MLNYNILNAKPTITYASTVDGSDTVECIDLLSKVLVDDIEISGYTVVEVTKDYIARPDLISLAMYGNDMYGDIICKVNGLSNPFELNEGMYVVVPEISYISKILKQGTASELSNSTDDYICAPTKNTQKAKNESRSANEQTIGETSFVIDKTNMVVYY